jgi:hypothetical protein
MKQQSQVNAGDIHPKVVYVMRLRMNRKVKEMSFKFLLRKTEGDRQSDSDYQIIRSDIHAYT